jgi:hypothetical protein
MPRRATVNAGGTPKFERLSMCDTAPTMAQQGSFSRFGSTRGKNFNRFGSAHGSNFSRLGTARDTRRPPVLISGEEAQAPQEAPRRASQKSPPQSEGGSSGHAGDDEESVGAASSYSEDKREEEESTVGPKDDETTDSSLPPKDHELEIKDVEITCLPPRSVAGAAITAKSAPNARTAKLRAADELAARWGGTCLSNIDTAREQTWKCAAGHIWTAPFEVVMEQFEWCGDCPGQQREAQCRVVLETLLDTPFPKAHPDWLRSPKSGKPLELDGYNEALKIAYEHQGLQHYAFVEFFHKTKAEFAALQARDAEKINQCERRQIVLLRIPYWATVPTWIRRELEGRGFIAGPNTGADHVTGARETVAP